MNRLHADIIRILIASQVAVLERAAENVIGPDVAMAGLEKCYKELGAAIKALKKEFS